MNGFLDGTPRTGKPAVTMRVESGNGAPGSVHSHKSDHVTGQPLRFRTNPSPRHRAAVVKPSRVAAKTRPNHRPAEFLESGLPGYGAS